MGRPDGVAEFPLIFGKMLSRLRRYRAAQGAAAVIGVGNEFPR
jgi:hypothetical protein